MCNIDICDSMKEHELCDGTSLVENVELLLTDPQSNMCRVRKDETYGHVCLNANDVVDAFKFGKEVVKLVSHDHVFCSALRFGQRLKALANEAERDSDDSNW